MNHRDILAALACAAESERKITAKAAKTPVALIDVCRKMGGQIQASEARPFGPRLTYILERYERHRK